MQALFDGFRSSLTRLVVAAAGGLMLLGAASARADLIELQNGDRYVGKILSMSSNFLTLQSEVLGTVKLPRAKVTQITLGAVTITNSLRKPLAAEQASAPVAALTNSSATDLGALLRQLGGSSTNLVQQVQKQYLSDAGPEANQKYNELMGGLLSGKIGLSDLRAQAKTAADQLRSLKDEAGDETGMLDSYLTILDKFLKESGPGTATNAPAPEKNLEPGD